MRIWVLILVALIAIGGVLLTQPTRDEVRGNPENAPSEAGATEVPLRGRAADGAGAPTTDPADDWTVAVDADGGGPDRSRTLRVSGRFIDSDGFGVAYEPITLEGSAWDWRSVVKTAADGSFGADLPEEVAPIRVIPGRRGNPLSDLAQVATQENPTVELLLPADRLFSGEVVDERGDPVAGATVSLGATRATSRKDGSFRMHLWGRTSGLKLVADPPARMRPVGYLAETLMAVNGGERDRRVVLKPKSGLFGVLRWTDGEPVGGAHLVITNQRLVSEMADNPAAWSLASVHGHTQQDGTLALGPLPGAPFTIAVSHGRPRRFVDEAEATSPGTRLALTVARPLPLRGRVTGTSVDGCTVIWTPTGARSAVELTRCVTHTDAAGRFEMLVPARFAGQLHVRSRGSGEYATQELHPREGANLAITLRPGLSISGIARGWPRDPEPYRIAVVARQGSLSARSGVDEEGAFAIGGLAPGRWTVELEVYTPTLGHGAPWGTTVDVEAGTTDVVLVATKRDG